MYTFWRQNKINRQNNEEKIHLQAQVDQVAEKQKFEYQKEITEFSLYATRKHERCIEFYEKLNKAVTQVNYQAQRFHRNVKTFENYGKEDVEKFLSDISITEKEKKQILDIWLCNTRAGCKELRELEIRVHKTAMLNSLADASEAYLRARLYLPKIFAEEIEKYITDLDTFANDMEELDELRKNICVRNDKEVCEKIHNEMNVRPQKAKEFIDRFEKITDRLQGELKGN